MGRGILYRVDNEQFKAGVDYNLQRESGAGYFGELTLQESIPVNDGGGYIIEFEDNRRWGCYLRRRINRAVNGFQSRRVYHFTGNDLSA